MGPQISDGPESLQLKELSVTELQKALKRRGWTTQGVLVQYTDPFLLRAVPMRNIHQWAGPRLLVCGDLHHGPDPVGTLQQYCVAEPHDAVLTFNPALLGRSTAATNARALLGPNPFPTQAPHPT